MINRVIDHCVDRWLRRCTHHDQHVAADILEGSHDGTAVAYCRRCGSVQVRYESGTGVAEWRRPRPLWYAHDGSQT